MRTFAPLLAVMFIVYAISVAITVTLDSFSGIKTTHFEQLKSSEVTHNIYLYDLIENGKNAADISRTFREAKEGDIVYLHINSPGGYVYLLEQIRNARSQTKAKLITYCESFCASAAAQIWMMGDTRLGADNSYIVVHRAFSETPLGKVLAPLNDRNERDSAQEMIESKVAACMSPKEQDAFFHGDDIEFTYTQFLNRLKAGRCVHEERFKIEYETRRIAEIVNNAINWVTN